MSEEDPFGRKAAAVEFLSLPTEKQYEWVKGIVFLARRVEDHKRHGRISKNKIIQAYKWRSYLTDQELMMFENLEREEAENVYNRSQKKAYKCLTPIQRTERRNFQLSEMDLPLEEDYNEPLTYPSSSDDDEGEYCSETKSKQTDEGVMKINIYDEEARNRLVEMVMAYRKRLEELKEKHMKSNSRN